MIYSVHFGTITKEYKHILNTKEVNGFDKQLIDTKIKTFRRLKHIKETTTLSTLDKNDTYKKLTHYPWAHKKFNNIFKHHNIVLMPQNKYSIIIF